MQNPAYYQRTNLTQITNLFKVLSDETRLRVLNLLLERECCVCEVMQSLNISQSKASRALKALYEVGILKLRKDSHWALYSIEINSLKGYMKDLVQTVGQALENNKKIKLDRELLKRVERVGPGLAEKLRHENVRL